VLVGPKGVGKTSLACAMLRQLADMRAHVAWRALYVRAIDLGVSRRDAPMGSRPRLIEDACRASLLLLDDLGQEETVGPLREVIHSRHDDCKPILVTTAWDNATLQQRYGEGVDRRLFERAAVLHMGAANGT
jgi:DNA replication protein DnaC